MRNTELDDILHALAHKYATILGEKELHPPSFEKIIDTIITYHENIISAMPGNIYWFDKHGVSIGCNKNVLDMMQLSAVKEFKGLNFNELGKVGHWSPQATLSFEKDTMEVIHSGKPKFNVEEPPIQHADGRVIYFLTSRVPLFDQEGDVIGMVGVSVDITEIKKLRDALKESKEVAEAANTAKVKFIENMTHDIRTPLVGILGMAKTVSQRIHDAEVNTYVEKIEKSSQQLLTFLNNILDEARLGNQPTVAKKAFSLESIIENLKDLLNVSFLHKKLKFILKISSDIPPVLEGDAVALHRILLNLLGNAIKFTHYGSITLAIKEIPTSSQKDDTIYIVFKIADTGIGIEEDNLKLIFEPFTRLHDTHEEAYAGTGLGLHITKKFIETLGGSISVTSKINKGSTFTVILPFKRSKTTLKAFRESSPRTKPLPTKLPPLSANILLVEDNEIVGEVLTLQFEHLGCKITLARSGMEAMTQFKENTFNIVYADIGLPDIKGYKLTQLLRAFEKETHRKKTPIIGLSAHASKETKDICLQSGMDTVINKPISDETIYQHINTFIPSPKNLLKQKSQTRKVSQQKSKTAIDLTLGTKRAGNNNARAKRMIGLLRKSILERLPKLQQFYAEKNWQELYAAVHHLYGAISFCGTPLLEAAAKALATIVSAQLSKHQEMNKIKACYTHFKKEVDRFLVESESDEYLID